VKARHFWSSILISLLFIIGIFGASAAPAHHSYAAFDPARTCTLEGSVKSFQWTNPHVVLTLWVKLADRDKLQEWRIESSSPSILTRFGWQRNSMKGGDRVRVIFNPLRDGSHGGRLHTLTMLATGQILKTKLSASTENDPKAQ
jgi:hypothetical protein